MLKKGGATNRAEETTMETVNLELFYDFRSHRARACWNGEELVLPEPFADRGAAEAAAVRHVRTVLLQDRERSDGLFPKIRIWQR